MSFIKVTSTVHDTNWSIRKALKALETAEMLSFDTETQPVYDKATRDTAKGLLKAGITNIKERSHALLAANNSGLSHPSLVNVRHFIFGTSESSAVVLIVRTEAQELLVWNWLAEYEGTLLIHGALFDLKIMHHRIGKFPKHYEDTQLLAKSLINHVDVWEAKVGLKELMGTFYDPAWTLIEDYEPANLLDPAFIRYSGIDGASCFLLYKQLQKHIKNTAL